MKNSVKTVASGRYSHPVYGCVRIKVHPTARRVKARWIGPEVCFVVPSNLAYDELMKFTEDAEVQKKILAIRPKSALYVGLRIDCDMVDFTIEYDAVSYKNTDVRFEVNDQAPLRGKKANYTIYINPRLKDTDSSEPEFQSFLNKNLLWAAKFATLAYVVPRAKELADNVGALPMGWNVKDIRRSLGKCDSHGIITLSSRLIFLSPDLRDFVIYHELAHLAEMNHSAAFHKVCDSYCNGREAELSARARSFEFPVF
jgi:hypothetical protein